MNAANKRLRVQKSVLALQKNGQKLNPVRIEGRSIARSFWGKAWCENLQSYSDYANRLPRGRTYLRNGSVVDFEIVPGEIRALVSGSDLYRITVKIQPVQKAMWKALKNECAGRVGSLIDLLQGKLSAQVMGVITRRETGLFPSPVEIGLSCSCPDWAGMCKHVAATLYAVGTRLDESPELLFVLRGADHLELVTEATESVTIGVSSPEDSATLLEENLSEVFGIEIEPAVLKVANTAGSELPKTSSRKKEAGTPGSKGGKKKGSGKTNLSPAGAALRGRKRVKRPSEKRRTTRTASKQK